MSLNWPKTLPNKNFTLTIVPWSLVMERDSSFIRRYYWIQSIGNGRTSVWLFAFFPNPGEKATHKCQQWLGLILIKELQPSPQHPLTLSLLFFFPSPLFPLLSLTPFPFSSFFQKAKNKIYSSIVILRLREHGQSTQPSSKLGILLPGKGSQLLQFIFHLLSLITETDAA